MKDKKLEEELQEMIARDKDARADHKKGILTNNDKSANTTVENSNRP